MNNENKSNHLPTRDRTTGQEQTNPPSANTASIHEFDYPLICEYFAPMKRQGPGSPEMTLKALSFIDNLTETSRIADLGCGTGGQTRVLALHTPGTLTGLDLFPGFIDRFNHLAREMKLQDRLQGIVGSMEHLPFREKSLDLIWSEGAIAHMGFGRGLREWRKYLKEGGYLAVTDASWFTEKRPEEIETFWKNAYPEIDTIPNNVAQIQKAGYLPVATFVLPETCWTEQYFAPQAAAREIFQKAHAGEPYAEELIASQQEEERLYHQYKSYYGYVFYIARKAGSK